MQDRFLFRGKRLDNGEWIIGHYLESIIKNPKVDSCVIKTSQDAPICLFEMHIIDPDTIGQCTGLKDKNGKLIFEGDILRLPKFKNGVKVIVKWIEKVSGFWLMDIDKYGSTYSKDVHGELEVEGNIYENQNLLECQ